MNDLLMFDWIARRLDENAGEVEGRADLPEEVRLKIERLSAGALPEAESQDIFELLRSDQDAIAYLADLLRQDAAEEV